MSKPTYTEVREAFSYDPLSGELRWRITRTNKTRAGDLAGSVMRSGHRKVGFNGNVYLAHRLIWLYMTGAWPRGQIDHIDTYGPKEGYGNRWDNLRLATNAENGRNHRRANNNTSGVTGVVWHKGINKWYATIRFNDKVTSLGAYVSFDDAVRARRSAEIKYFGEFAPLHEEVEA